MSKITAVLSVKKTPTPVTGLRLTAGVDISCCPFSMAPDLAAVLLLESHLLPLPMESHFSFDLHV